MACYEEKVVATAVGEIGYKETGNNITKYSEFFDKNHPDFYNTKKQGAEYCDIFVDYCVMVNSDSEQEAEYVLCQPAKSCGAGCSFSYEYYRKAGRTGNEPKLGAQIFLNTNKKSCAHTGLVVGIDGDSVITVEGNSDNMVKRHTYKKTSSKIFGYGYPRYTEAVEEKPVEEPTTTLKSVSEVADEVIAGKWGNNPERKQRLTEAGYNYDEVQAEVNRKLKGNQTASQTAPTPAKATTTYKVKTNTGAPLRLRAKPNTSCTVHALINNGTKIEVSEISKGWAKTTYNGNTGWCAMSKLVKV